VSTVDVPLHARSLQADVLVVDDEADVRRSICEVLQVSGFTVVEAEDGAVAFGLLRENRYGMVLLDIRMPKLDGVTLLEALEELPPVVVHSAFSLSADERQRLGVKVVQFLHKPVSPQLLLSAVQGVLRSGSET
jgi:DNA-binding response OmpR family regulator